MTHDKLAERIVEHLRATHHRHDGDDPRSWSGDNASQIRWGTKTHVDISSSLTIANSLGAGRYSCPLELLHKIENAKALVIKRGW